MVDSAAPRKPAAMVDVAVHRLRNLNYTPDSIVCLHTLKTSSRIVVARTHAVELVRLFPKVHTIATIAVSSKITCLEDLGKTVFGAFQDQIGILDFADRGVVRSIASNGGGVFCLTTNDNLLYAGCQDGTIRVYNESLELQFSLPNCQFPVTSMVVHADHRLVFAGVADGTIRCFQDQKPKYRITVESQGRTTPTKIWALAIFQYTLVSADSLGNVQFWDVESGTWKHSIAQNPSKADVLCLAVVNNRLFASGVDARVICIERNGDYWGIAHAQRPHTHDVHGLVVKRDVLLSGGIDSKLVWYTATEFGRHRPRIMYPWPSQSPIHVSAARVSMHLRDTVHLTELGTTELPVFQTKAVAETHVELRVPDTHLTHHCASGDGRWVAFTDGSGWWLYDVAGKTPKSRTVPNIPGRVVGMDFVRDDCLVLATASEALIVVEITETGVKEKQKLQRSRDDGCFAVHAVVGNDSWFATWRHGDAHSTVDVFGTNNDGDFEYWWTLPKLERFVTAINFLDAGTLAVACVDYSVYLFDVAEKKLNPWSEAAGYPIKLPQDLVARRDFPVHITANPASPNVILMASFGVLVAIDTTKPVPVACRFVPEQHVRGGKRKRTSAVDGNKENSCTLCLRYNGMLFMGFCRKNEMVVVEQPWLNVVSKLPAALQRKVFAT